MSGPDAPGRIWRRLLCTGLAAFGLMLLRTMPAAAFHLTDPWPDADSLSGIEGERVSLESSDPFAPRDIGRARARTVTGLLFLPPNARGDHAVPAVVMLHGSAGLIADRAKYGPQLAAMGIAVLLIETYDSRRDLATSFVGRVLAITETMFVADAYGGLRYLAGRPEIDPRRVVLAGFSYGGMAATYALYAQMADALAPPGLRFAGHVAYYAPCIARFRDSRTTGAPLLMLYGGQDQLMRSSRCDEIAGDLRGGGSEVTIIVYPTAVHQWDGGRPRGLIGRQLADCRFVVEPDGTVRDARTAIPMSGPFLRKIILGLCTGSRPYPIGRDDAVRAQSNRDFGRFLARVLREHPRS
ncbi:MAG: dienelactone hydrolase family protein [Acetobacteraceae bacterium]|nr:dienelactone hydrolase family protein [Acetobacteraceae bacterium]